MDSITSAIVATLPLLAVDTMKASVKDAYDAVKEVIRRYWGAPHPLSRAIEGLEGNPNSQEHAMVLSESVADAKADQNRELMKAVAQLTEVLQREGVQSMAGQQVTIKSGVVQGVVGAGSVSIGSMNFGIESPNKTKVKS